jgi:hypothetical protein
MISSTTSKVQYLLSSTTETLAVPFYFLENTHLKVIKTVDDVQTVLSLGTHYTVTGAGVSAGGSVVLTGTGVAVGNTVTVKRSVPLTQLVDYVYNDRFPAETHEKALDKLTMICQFLQEQAERSLRFEDGEVLDGTMQIETRKGKFIYFDSTDGTVQFGDVQDVLDAAVDAEAAKVAAQAAQAAAEDARDVALSAMAALVVDVVNYGVTPSATAAVNRAGFQAACDAVEAAGGGEIQFNVAGFYLLNATVFIPGNCIIRMAPGAVLKKSIAYGEVLLNKGALTRTFNENIHLIGLTLDVSAGGVPRQNIYGLMGEIGLYYVKKWSIDRVRCDTVHASQFFIHTCRAEDGEILYPRIKGEKDCLHFSGGTKRVLVLHDNLQGYDDRRALNAGDYVECTPEMGDIEDIQFIGGYDAPHTSAYGYATRIVNAAWGNYANGITTVRRGTTVVNGSFIYRCTNAVGAGPFTSANAPVHTTLKQEVTGADGIKWMCYQPAGITSANVRRVTWGKMYFANPGSGAIVYANWINDTYDQSVTPGNEALSETVGLTFDDCTYASGISGTGLVSNGNVKSVRWVNCTGLDNLTTIFGNSSPSGTTALTSSALTTKIVMTGNVFVSAMSNFMDLRRSNTTVELFAMGNASPDSLFLVYQNGSTTFKVPVCDIYVGLGASVGGGSVTPVQGHIVRTLNAFGGWLIANAAGEWKKLARELDTNSFKALTLSVADANDELLQQWGGSSTSYGWKWKLNGASTGDLQLFRTVNGVDTELVRFARGTGRATFAEYVVLDGATGKTIRYTNGTANGTVATTLGSVGPTGANAGNPLGWMRININGTDRFVPYW